MSTENNQKGVITKYKIVAGLHAFLGVGLLMCAIMGTLSAQEDDDFIGPPFFIGGYLVGILNVFAAICATCVVVKGWDTHISDVKRQVGCAIRVHQIVAMLNIMMCFVGVFFAGKFVANYEDDDSHSHDEDSHSHDDDSYDDDMSEIRDRNRIIACAIIAGCVVSVLMTIFVLYLVCIYGSDFGVKSNFNRMRFKAFHTVNPINAGITTPSTYPAQTSNSKQMEQLRAQNLLLQQQVSLQQQQLIMYHQQQQGFSGGQNYPSPPSYSAVMSDPSYPPPNHAVPSAPDSPKSS